MIQLSVVALAALLSVLVEALLVGLRGGVMAGVWALGLWALPAAIFVSAMAAPLAAGCDEEAWGEVVSRRLAARDVRDAVGVGLVCASVLLVVVYGLARSSRILHNAELSALLVALSVLVAALLIGALGVLVWRVVRGRAPMLALGAATLLLALLLLCFSARSGFAQLDPRLAASPVSLVVALLLADRSSLLRARSILGTGIFAALTLPAFALFLASPERTVTLLAESGAWSSRLMASVRAISDFDGDRYSSWLGGGDCAPFDATINPGAVELIGDGIDNNCIGGDAGKTAAPRRPSWGASAHGAPSGLNVVVVTIETLRHDHASFVRASRDTTPNLRALGGESLVFERMYSAAPHTRLAIATLFSSYAPSEIDWQPLPAEKRMRRIGPATPWLPELLSARGYETIAVLTDFAAFTAQEDAGFDRGFRHYDVSTKLNYRGGTMWGFPAAEQVDKALTYVRAAKQPFLLWLHLFEPHYTYEQPPDAPRFGGDEQARYDAEIWHVDHQLGRLFAGLRELGAWDKTLLFVTGDHGEAFGEHDDRWHGSNLFDPQLRPAAMLRIPGMPGKRIDGGVTFSDVAPTLARLIGDRQTFDQLRGRSLAPLLHHRKLPDDESSFVAESFSVDDGHAYQAALISYPLKLIYVEAGRRFSLFDLSHDPGESRPLDADDARAAPLRAELIGYLERTRPRSLGKSR